ncbi:Predicted DNA-binding transcriptional regulator YafY, contains an HTH and WYL domains [Paenibacillus sp. UNCCL117]|uniref:helix-turn-helix transcriptional regulator n=1 Tax=unclassified Paenibacillus TaxID=185978 RepID=UPI0008830C8B|nr:MULTISPECIES: YafY family protein [unclassified Paenibacillus]SDD78377.1 Predicted DNA-binding transcriptional regulator YafY, contains an HTH and WYL domains [Paenibacillus sp. cl123]SFW52964.1 Predicted DNA-binding transcriptional regulator YafY, contains an HTH and WYL domains [Paenibacillus sp. UNCCL117]
MNKTDRLLAIVLELQRKGTLRAEDLAARFETSVRTIYRDVQALSEAGVPVIGAPGVGYSLMEGYFLPPVSLTGDEAVTVLIGMEFVEQWFDEGYAGYARSAREKVEAVLPAAILSEAKRTGAAMRLLEADARRIGRTERAYIHALRRAVLEERKVDFDYAKGGTGDLASRQSHRTADPYGLVLVRGAWILLARCELRRELRHFRLSRMSRLNVRDDKFVRPPDFELQTYQPENDRHLKVVLRVQPEIADRVKEAGSFYLTAMEDDEAGLLVTLHVRQPEDVLQWVLGWGADAEVLEPESLRCRVREEAVKLLERY